jgi:WD40 repeat protein/serine/threonine protein kinase
MTPEAYDGETSDGQDRVLAHLLNDALEALQAGRSDDVDALLAQWPQYANELQALVSVMQTCAHISRASEAGASSASGTAIDSAELGTLGDFVIHRELGRGGMGIVYEAHQLSLRRRVALKVLPFAGVLDGRQLQRFQNEAQAAALLHHSHIVPVYGVGCERGVHYYAMQLIKGPTLAQVIRNLRSQAGLERPPAGLATNAPRTEVRDGEAAPATPRAPSTFDELGDGPPRDRREPAGSTAPHSVLSASSNHRSSSFVRAAVQLGLEVAEALDYAHSEGVLHRDIKPGNLLLDERGRVWVTDFGLARIEADPGLTRTGDIVGTLRYMCPEQALAQRVAIDGRADVYSLGATLYELLTLEPVFDGDDRGTLLRQIAFDEPRPPRQRERTLPVELETILLKTLAKQPADRYATAGALAEDLRRFLDHRPILAQRPSWWDRGAKWALRNRSVVATAFVGLLITVVTLAAAGLMIWREQRKTQQALEAALTAQATADRAATRAQQLAIDVQRHSFIHSQRLIQQYAEREDRRDMVEQLDAAREYLQVDTIPTFSWYYWWHQCRNDPLFVLPGQRGMTQTVTLSSNGGLLAAAGLDGAIRTWDVTTGTMRHTLQASTSALIRVAMSLDGRWLATVSDMDPITVWDLHHGTLAHEFFGHSLPVLNLHFSEDSQSLASVDGAWVVNLWDLTNGRRTPASGFGAPKDPTYAWSHDGQRVATVGSDGCLRIYGAQPHAPTEAHDWHGDIKIPEVPTAALGYTPDDRHVVWVGIDGQLQVLDVNSLSVSLTRQLPVQTLVWSDFDGRSEKLVTVDANAFVQLWEIPSAHCLARLEGSRAVKCIMARNGERVALTGPDRFVSVWQPFVRPAVQPTGHARGIRCVAMSPDGQWLASGSDDHSVRIWNTRDGRELMTLEGHSSSVLGVEFSPDGQLLASSSLDGTVRLWHVEGWQEVRTLRGHEQRVCCAAFSPDGTQLASGGEKVIIWDVRAGDELRALQAEQPDRVNVVRYSPDGSLLAVAGNAGRVYLYETRNWEVRHTLVHDDEVWAGDFTPDGRTLATGDKAGNVSLWNMATGTPLIVQPAHKGYTRSVRFSHDGKTLASAGDDHQIRLWDALEGLEICALAGHAEKIYALAFAPDDSLLASGSDDGAIRFWHAEKPK